MKLKLAVLALVASVTGSVAADLPRQVYTKAPASVAPPAFSWTGFYLGAHVGGAFAGSNPFGNSDARLMGGGQIGADYQFAPNWVLGIEGNYSFIDSNGSGLNFFRNRNLGSVTGRLGYAWGPALFYAKGGYAWADTSRSFGFTGNNGENGYTVGGGIEYMLTQNWSAKLEYQYYNLGNVTFVSAPPFVVSAFNNEEHTIKLGVNYRFNWGGTPVASRY